MRIAVARETEPGETRVALVPELVGRLTGAGYEVAVEPGAGRGALIDDQAYVAAGATVSENALHGAGLVLSVQPIGPEALRFCAPRAATVSFLFAGQRADDVAARQAAGITTFAMEQVPRISRAQSMDALSSQALVSGYRGAVVAAGRLREFFPLSMTAAGTVRPAQILVLGAGVAGLQAIATCRRLGAVVKGYDVRAAAAEEIASLGATPLDLDLPTLDGAGGYAREMSEERAQLQRERLAPHIAAAHAVITTAAVPGRQAPVLVTTSMVAGMRPGSVVVDLAADSGGNVEGRDRRRRGQRTDRRRTGQRAALGRGQRAESDARAGQPALRPERAQRGVADDPGSHVRPRLRRRDRGRDVRDPSEPDDRDSRCRSGGRCMSDAITWLTIFVLAAFVGIEVISKVSSTLHTPLMSGANAIHGIILVGAILVAGHADSTPILVLSLTAVVLASINLAGGFVVTDRMLQMFVRKKPISGEQRPEVER